MEEECGDPSCQVSVVDISTGYDHNNATTYVVPPTKADAWWTLVNSPNSSLVVPSPAFVITKNAAWAAPFAGSQWISAYGTNTLYANNKPPLAPYSFERCICVCEAMVLHLDFDMYVDNVADVYFDGVLVASQSDKTTASFTVPFEVDTLIPVEAGEHCLRIDVRNWSAVAMGLDVQGTISSSPSGLPLMISPQCCQQKGKLIVCKFKDSDCNGLKDNPPVPLAGWTFTLSPGGATAVTDGAGYAYFTVDPGAYTVTETPLPGWNAGTPSGGTLNVNIQTGAVQLVEFLNCPVSPTSTVTVCKYLDADCNGVADDPPVPLANWGFTVVPGNITKYTNAGGCATFALLPGLYTITEATKPGWMPTNPSSGSLGISVAPASSQSVSFLNCATNAVINVYKLLDLDCDGVGDDVLLPGWTFTFMPGGYTATTDASGCAMIAVPGGTYTITETPKLGWVPTDPVSGSLAMTVENGEEVGLYFLNCMPWKDPRNGGTAGTNGTPVLTGIGLPYPFTSGGFDIAMAPPLSVAFLSVHVGAYNPVPFKCGTLSAFPPDLLFKLFTDGAGKLSLPFVWPGDLPSGLTITAQFLFPDPGAVCGFAMSNAIQTSLP
jgi:hypothetical protein